MLAIALGMPSLVLFMALVMGTPLRYHLKHDRKYENARGQPQSVKNQIWYER